MSCKLQIWLSGIYRLIDHVVFWQAFVITSYCLEFFLINPHVQAHCSHLCKFSPFPWDFWFLAGPFAFGGHSHWQSALQLPIWESTLRPIERIFTPAQLGQLLFYGICSSQYFIPIFLIVWCKLEMLGAMGRFWLSHHDKKKQIYFKCFLASLWLQDLQSAL